MTNLQDYTPTYAEVLAGYNHKQVDEDPDLAVESSRSLYCPVQLFQLGQDAEKYYSAKESYFAALLSFETATGCIRSRLAERRLRKAVRQMRAVTS